LVIFIPLALYILSALYFPLASALLSAFSTKFSTKFWILAYLLFGLTSPFSIRQLSLASLLTQTYPLMKNLLGLAPIPRIPGVLRNLQIVASALHDVVFEHLSPEEHAFTTLGYVLWATIVIAQLAISVAPGGLFLALLLEHVLLLFFGQLCAQHAFPSLLAVGSD
jgi:hypothetical protein